jgi:hypothetical protein
MQTKPLHRNFERFGHRPIELVLVRANSALFYSVATASLLETVAPAYAQRLLHLAAADRVLSEWVVKRWLPRKAARAKALQSYVEETWPEFDWNGALEHYRASIESEGGLGPRRATLARELLARCVASAQTSVFYRSLSRWADDRRLREIARGIVQDEAVAFRRFRIMYERSARAEGFGCASSWRTALGCVRASRDTQLPVVFRAIDAQCSAHMPFPMMRHGEFVKRMRAVIERTSEFSTAERVLFNPWRKRRTMPRVEQQVNRHPDWFKPVFRKAA